MAPTTNIKLPGRQTNNSLSSLTGNIFLPNVFGNKNNATTNSENTKNKEKPSSSSSSNTENIPRKKKSKSSEVPMDLLKMEEKLDNGEYKKFSEFKNDFKLIVNNCRLYNGQNNEYTEMVNNLQEAFDKATKKYFDQNSSDEDGNIGYPDSKMNVFREKYSNKSNTTKTVQKEMIKKNKEKNKNEKCDINAEKQINQETAEGSRANKRKRKDKDKRRKKKSKTKQLIKSEEDDDHGEDSDEDSKVLSPNGDDNLSDLDSEQDNVNRNKRRLNQEKQIMEHKRRRESSPDHPMSSSSSSKKSKKKSGFSKEQIFENEKSRSSSHSRGKSISSKKSENEKVNKKHYKINKKGLCNKSLTGHSDDESEKSHAENRDDDKSDKEFSSDNCLIDYPIQGKTHKKHSSSHQVDAKQNTEKIKSTKSSTNKNKQGKQKSKSKLKRTTSSTSVSTTEETSKPKNLSQDNKNNSLLSKKKRAKTKKCTASAEEYSYRWKNDDTLSRSPSPIYTVDLHKKYAQSASSRIEDEIFNTKSKSPVESVTKIKSSPNRDDSDFIFSRRTSSRSPSPTNSLHSDNQKTNQLQKNDSKKKEINKKAEATSHSPSQSTPETELKLPPFMDKYDLIKQRRNRNPDEKWNQIVKEAEKIKDNKKNTATKAPPPPPSKEKNQKLRETIEKLKAKNAKSKERSVLIDEIFGVKPTCEIRDEKTIFEKLRETCLDSKLPMNNKKLETTKKFQNEYNFNENALTGSPSKSRKKESVKDDEKPKPSSNKKSSTTKRNSSHGKKNSSKTNMEALELETEQTLKDINRWLEHTPRFPEFSSASNSPSRYNLLDDFDAVASKLDPNDFRRPVPITPSKIDSVPKLTETFEEIAENKKDVIPDLIPPTNSTISSETHQMTPPNFVNNTPQQKPKESNVLNTTQLLPHPPPPPPHVKSQQQKENKRKTFKEKLTANNRRKDLLRTIDRLQPGKTKGNLITNMHNVNKPEEIFPLGAAAKIKEVKNSLVVKTDESAPKLSLGTVLNTEGFGLGQLHNFGDDVSSTDLKVSDSYSNHDLQEKKGDVSPNYESTDKLDDFNPKKEEQTSLETKPEKTSATPNLSAWFKAFGAPKKAKKAEEEEKRNSENNETSIPSMTPEKPPQVDQVVTKSTFNPLKSPPGNENFSLPAPRQRKASTGSTISERSSFSQDPDSPRIGIDDRFGAYPGPYASPIGASPIMVSPKPEELGKPSSPYPLNGAIKVGFYQDTTTKSSPEKSCSPRELPSPYPQYSQHVYSSASSPNVNSDINSTYVGCYTSAEQNKTPVYPSNSPSSLYDQYKQPQSQESDYNSSMSPNTNPSSPYQQSQTSPYQQHPNSPYHQTQNSPYQQPQTSPFHNQSGTTSNIISAQSPNSQQSPVISQSQQQNCDSPGDPHSPYQQPMNSPYQQPINSPYNQQNPASPYQQQQAVQQPPLGYCQQQSPASSASADALHQPNKHAFNQESAPYPMHKNSPHFQQNNQPPPQPYEQEIPKRPPSIINKLQNQPEWNNTIDISNQTPQSVSGNLTELHPMVPPHISNQLDAATLQNDSLHPVNTLQHENNKEDMQQYQGNYQQYKTPIKEQQTKPQNIFNSDISLHINQQRQITPQEQIVKNNQENIPKSTQSGEADIVNLGYPDHQSNKLQQQKDGIDKSYDAAQSKHQQMFDSFLGSMAVGKNLGFGKPLDISTSKAFEMFNRAATMGFPKELPNSLIGNKQDTITTVTTTGGGSAPQQHITQQTQQPYHMPTEPPNTVSTSNANKPLNMVNNSFNQSTQQQMQLNQNDAGKLQTFQNVHPNSVDKLHQQQNSSLYPPQKLPQQHQTNTYSGNLVPPPSSEKTSNELIIPNPRQDQMAVNRNQHLNMDIPNYKPTFNNPTTMLDPLRNINHPLAVMDEGMINLQNTSPTGYYDKNIPPAHIFTKNISQQIYQNPSPYGAREQQNPTGTYVPPASNVPVSQQLETLEPKVSKRTRKKKSSTPTPIELAPNNQNQNNILANQTQIPIQGQPHQNNQMQQNSQSQQQQQQQQGFQLYAGLKTAATTISSATDTSAISLKSATSMVPGSAFNFGPSPPGLGLPSSIYGDNSGYLEEFRGAANPYYIPPGHRSTPDAKPEGPGNSAAPPPPPPTTYHQFLTHTSPRGPYPFMNSQLDPPMYQQYLQRQEEFRARMMLNQGLLAPSAAAAAAGYPQPSYRPTLGMPKPPYDMNRQPWF